MENDNLSGTASNYNKLENKMIKICLTCQLILNNDVFTIVFLKKII